MKIGIIGSFDIITIAESEPMEIDQILYNKPMSATKIREILGNN